MPAARPGTAGPANSVAAVGPSYDGMLIWVLASDQPASVRGAVFVDEMNVESIDAARRGRRRTDHRPISHRVGKERRSGVRAQEQLARVRCMPLSV